MMYFDPLYFLLLAPAMLLAFWAQWRVKANFATAAEQPAGMSGAEAARAMLNAAGLQSVGIERVAGFLSDHYDPRAKVLRLSPEVYGGHHLAAVGIAAHEAGHAIQDATRYAPLVIRNLAVPLAGFGGNTAMLVFIVGLFMGGASTAFGAWVCWLGVGLFATVVFFQLVNLPVEFDASARAKEELAAMGIVHPQQAVYVNKVLNAAAWTYVAGTLSAVLTLVYMLIRSGLLGNRR